MKNFSTLVQFLYTFIHRSSVLSSFDLHPFAMRSFVPAPFCHALFWRRAYLGTLLPHALLAVNYIFYISYFQVCTFQNSCCSKVTLVSTIFFVIISNKMKKIKRFPFKVDVIKYKLLHITIQTFNEWKLSAASADHQYN